MSTNGKKKVPPAVGHFNSSDENNGQVEDLNKQLTELEKITTRFQSIANLVPDMLWESEPDGSTSWYNQRWLEYTGQSFEEAIGWGWVNAIHPDDRAGWEKRYTWAFEQGKNLRQEHRIRRHDGEYRWFAVNASPLKDEQGKVIKMYGAATDIHDRKLALEASRASDENFRTLFENIDEGFAIIELEYDNRGKLKDMVYLQANPAFQTHTGLSNPVGKRVSELMPNLEQSIVDMILRVADTGEPERAETYKIDLQRWFDVVYTRIGGPGSSQIAALFKDITEPKRQEEQVKRELQDTQLLQQISNHIIDEADREVFYNALLDSSMRLMSADFAGIQLLHPQEQELSLLAYKNLHPSSAKHWQLVQAGSTSTCGYALATGERVIVSDLEHPCFNMSKADHDAYKLSGINAVQSTPLISRLGTQVGMMSTHWRKPHMPSGRELGLFDIVARQVADLFERDRSAAALRESEEKYRNQLEQDVQTRTAELSASKKLLQATMDASMNMVQVFEAMRNAAGEIIDFRYVLLNHEAEKLVPDAIGKTLLELQPGVVAEGIFDTFKQVVETGIANQSERHYVHEQFDGWFYQSAVKLGDGVATTTTDITARKAAEERLRRMEDEQQLEIFRVILRTQEEERRRISESLHNGLGQMLYGIKMSLNQLNIKSAVETPAEFESSKRYTNNLLTEAIHDSRRISHELMPAVLEEFGLKAAVKDICQQMQEGVKFKCLIKVEDGQIDKYMQLAVFRTLQELMLNVVKHAKATKAEAWIGLENGHIILSVSDNGRGIDMEKKGKDGVGLASIRSKVDLLNGTINIDSAPGKGTSVIIRYPYKPQK